VVLHRRQQMDRRGGLCTRAAHYLAVDRDHPPRWPLPLGLGWR
jgi:hypothetical protein